MNSRKLFQLFTIMIVSCSLLQSMNQLQSHIVKQPDNSSVIISDPLPFDQCSFIKAYECRESAFSFCKDINIIDPSFEEIAQMFFERIKDIPGNKKETLQKFVRLAKQLETGKESALEHALCPYYPDAWNSENQSPYWNSFGYKNVKPFEFLYDPNDKHENGLQNFHKYICPRLDEIEKKCNLTFNKMLQITPFLLYLFKPVAGYVVEKALPCFGKQKSKLMRKHTEMFIDITATALVTYAYVAILTGYSSTELLTNPFQLALFAKTAISAVFTVFRLFNLKDLKSMSFKDSLFQIMLLAGMTLFPTFIPKDLPQDLAFKIPMGISFVAQVHHNWVSKNIQITFGKIKKFFGAIFGAVEKMSSSLVANPEQLNEQLMN